MLLVSLSFDHKTHIGMIILQQNVYVNSFAARSIFVLSRHICYHCTVPRSRAKEKPVNKKNRRSLVATAVVTALIAAEVLTHQHRQKQVEARLEVEAMRPPKAKKAPTMESLTATLKKLPKMARKVGPRRF